MSELLYQKFYAGDWVKFAPAYGDKHGEWPIEERYEPEELAVRGMIGQVESESFVPTVRINARLYALDQDDLERLQ